MTQITDNVIRYESHIWRVLPRFFPFATHSFATQVDPHAGMVAAREMGLAHYVEFQRHGKPDSAALFFWRRLKL